MSYKNIVVGDQLTDDSVTNEKTAEMATQTLKGRASAGTGDSEDLTATDVRTIINVEDGADVTDSTNVDAAGAVMEADTSTATYAFVVDEDNMISNSATKVPTQQSVKAYVDAVAASEMTYKGGYDATTNTPVLDTDNVVLTGSIDPAASTAVVGVGTLFTTELQAGDEILVSGETRIVDTITDDTNLTVTVAFSDNANDASPEKVGTPISIAIGDVYTVTVSGSFFTETVSPGDMIIAEGNDPTTLSEWTVVEQNLNPASETVAGYIEIATQAEVNAETDGTRAVTPATLSTYVANEIGGIATEDLATTLTAGNTTGGADIEMTAGDTINGLTSNHELDLDASGAWQITNAGSLTAPYLYGDATDVYLYTGNNAGFSAGAVWAEFSHNGIGMTGIPQAVIGTKQFTVNDTGGLLPDVGNIYLMDITLASDSATAISNTAVVVNTDAATFNTGVDYSVSLGGSNITAKTNNTAYANQISLQPASNTFDGILAPPTLTADRTWTFPDATGTVALTSDIVAETLAATLTAGNTTSGTDIVMTGTDSITSSSTTNQIDLDEGGEFLISTDNGAWAQSYMYANATTSAIGVDGGSNEFACNTTANQINFNFAAAYTRIGISAFTQTALTSYSVNDIAAITVANNTADRERSMSVNTALIFNSGVTGETSTYKSGVLRSTINGGKGITAKTNDTAYMNQASLQPSGNAFDMLLVPSASTADRTATFQDASGTVAYLSDIPAAVTDTLADTLAEGFVTGANDISVDSGQVILGTGTNNKLNLNASGAWQITNNATPYNAGYVYGDSSSAYLAFGSQSNFVAQSRAISMSNDGSTMVGDPYLYMTAEKIGVADSGALAETLSFKMADVTTTGTSASVSDNTGVIINSGGATTLATVFNSGVKRSVVIGGEDMTVNRDNSVFANLFAAQNAGETKSVAVKAAASITADRTQTLQDSDGVIALLSDVTATSWSVTAQSTNYTAADKDVVLMTAGATDKTVTLPAATANVIVNVKLVDNGAGNCIIATPGAETIDGAASRTITLQYEAITLIADGTNWHII